MTLFIVGEFWDDAFIRSELMWGLAPTASALFARDYFAKLGVTEVLIPGIGYGRNAKPFLEQGMQVTGIEVSETAIALARSKLGLDITIHHGSVLAMPFDPGVKMFFYDETSIRREFAPFGLVEISKIDEPMSHGSTRPFLNVLCKTVR